MEYYYHRTTRNVIYSFKTLFENIEMRRIDDKGKIVNQIKVPIALVSKNRGVVITDSQPDNTDKVEAVVPSMTYELTDFSYSSQDKQNPLERVQTRHSEATVINNSVIPEGATIVRKIGKDTLYQLGAVYFVKFDEGGIQLKSNANGDITFGINYIESFSPVIYTLGFALYITTTKQSDMFQIIEQILPRFTPNYNLRLKLFPDLKLIDGVDVSFNLVSTNIDNDWSGSFSENRYIQAMLEFTAKVPYFRSFGNPSDIIFTNMTNVRAIDDTQLTGVGQFAVNNTKVIFEGTPDPTGFRIEDEWIDYEYPS